MGNNLNYNCITNTEYINLNEKNHLKRAQQKLKTMPNSKLPQEMLKATVAAMLRGTHVVEDVCSVVNQFPDGWISFSDIKGKDNMGKFHFELKFIKSLEVNDDFIKAYVFKEDKNTIWILIKDSSFDFNKNYLKYAREFKKNNECDFDIVIFDEDEMDELEEQLKYIGEYKEMKKDAN